MQYAPTLHSCTMGSQWCNFVPVCTITIEYRGDDITKNFFLIIFFAFQRFGYHVSVEHDEKHPPLKFGVVGISSWLHEYLISPIEISVNWPGSKQL